MNKNLFAHIFQTQAKTAKTAKTAKNTNAN